MPCLPRLAVVGQFASFLVMARLDRAIRRGIVPEKSMLFQILVLCEMARSAGP